ncbi:MAG: hypothetical protein WC262_12275, partial [Bacteroidales bacterium]
MKRTAIRYITRADSVVKITGIDNAATIADIKKEFGEKVWDKYQAGHPFYYGMENKRLSVHFERANSTYLSQIQAGDLYTHEGFATLIAVLQAAGNR